MIARGNGGHRTIGSQRIFFVKMKKLKIQMKYITIFFNSRKPYGGRGSSRTPLGAYSAAQTHSWWGGALCPARRTPPVALFM